MTCVCMACVQCERSVWCVGAMLSAFEDVLSQMVLCLGQDAPLD